MDQVEKFYEEDYSSRGFGAQRKYPNEELCRFMGRNFFFVPADQCRNKRILEVGSESGANLWMIAKEGFKTYGVDLSQEAVKLAKIMLDRYNTEANISVQNMCNLKFDENYFDAIVDLFSSYCLDKEQGGAF